MNKQIKPSEKDGTEAMYVCKYKRMMRVPLHGPVMLSDVTQNRRYALFICGEIPLHYGANTV